MDLYSELRMKMQQLDECTKQLRVNGSALADAEMEYKVRLRAECLALRDEGMPVTLIQLTAYGIPEIAELRHARDLCDVIYSANKDAIVNLRREIEIIDRQISREMQAPSFGYGSM